MADKVELYLSKKKNEAKTPEVAQIFQNFESLYSKKKVFNLPSSSMFNKSMFRLWHQLTQELRKQMYNATFVNNVNLKEFYDSVIRDLEFRINLLFLTEIAMPVAREIFKTDKQGAFDFLKKIQNSVKKDKQATIRATSGLIELHLVNKDVNGCCVDITQIRSMIEETQKEVDDLIGVTPVHAPFYKVSATYLKEIGDYAGYYREALRYLGCEDAQKLTQEEKHIQAMLLGFAALLGEDIYNFGELLAHPILNALKGSDQHWLVDVLYSFNSGDLNKFREYESKWGVWNDIKKNKEALEGKIRLLCLMEIALGRNSKERHISFNEIATKAFVDVNKVEALVMKALSKGLVQGSIDQVNRMVHITWVQPRVLSPAQVYQMSERVGAWKVDVEKMEAVVRENAKEILMKT